MIEFTNKNERLTAIVCTLVAIAILAAGVTARQDHTSASAEPAQWESDVRYQIRTAFRHDARERDARLAQVQAVMDAWKVSTQGESDREKLIDWLSDTVVRSMPGSVEELPTIPEFSERESTGVVQSPPIVMPRQLSPPVLQTPTLLTNVAVPDLQVTPTPYDPFGEDGEEYVAEATEKSVVLAQPLAVVPTQKRTANKIIIEAASLPPAPLPDSSLTSHKTSEDSPRVELPTQVKASLIAESVAVNLTELAARIAGYHDGLDEVETALLRANNASLALVTEQTQRLDTMTRDYRFVKLYYESLTAEERQSLLAPRPLSATLREVSRQLDLYEQSQNADFLGSIDVGQATQIAELRELLSTIGARVDN